MTAQRTQKLRTTKRPSRHAIAALLLAALALSVIGATSANAAPIWRLDSTAAPTELPPGGEGLITATASNLGDEAVTDNGAHPVTITDQLPARFEVSAGVTASTIAARVISSEKTNSSLTCQIEDPGRHELSCTTMNTTQSIRPFSELKMLIPITADHEATNGEQNTISVTGGETPAGQELPAPPVLHQSLTVGPQETAFGVEKFELKPEEEDGAIDTRAGSHPYQLTTVLNLNEKLSSKEGETREPSSPAPAKTLGFKLPPGLLGNPTAVPQCSEQQFATIGEDDVNACPSDTAVGVAIVTLNLPAPPLDVFTEAVPVFNLAPASGEPARFGFEDQRVPVILDTSVRTGGDYGVTVTVENITEAAQLLSSSVTLWGQPGEASHDQSRGWACLFATEFDGETCTTPTSRPASPFLALPTSCTGPLSAQVTGEAWTGQTLAASYTLKNSLEEPLATLEACAAVPFSPEISVAPSEEDEGTSPGGIQSTASTPTGLNIEISLPAEAGAISESALRDTTVTLPPGMELNPSAANGLTACAESQVGFEGAASAPDPLAPGIETPLQFSQAPEQCPESSKIGLVRIKSPDLSHELSGGVYLAEPAPNGEAAKNPFNTLLALYLIAEDPSSGVRVKLAGHATVNEQTGQITTTFSNSPEVPFETLHLHLFEGPRASLTTPPSCGIYTTEAALTPWSGNPLATPITSFQIATGVDGASCEQQNAFTPGFEAGSTNNQAGAFTSFTVQLSRPDGQQPLSGLTLHLPPGVAALLASLSPCHAPAPGEQWSCGGESLIGHSVTSAGLGPDPYQLPGTVYLTEGYAGAPFGLLVVTPAVAGPFNLGDVDVRSRITVDPTTAAVTITSDPLPQFVRGIPVQLKALDVTVDRPNFEFNPTNCNPKSITGSLSGEQGTTASVSSRFQVGGCDSLPFSPVLTATTPGQGSRANGTAFHVKINSAGLGQANIAKVDLRLPKQLPTRQSTIKLACTESVFDANPASCDPGSVIGTATVLTPILKSPLTGPGYLVSHGGAEFPDVEFVLQGEGIKLILDGHTDINDGYTYSKFEAAPDEPFTSFETTLPAGPHSALGVYVPESQNYNVCKTPLTMPTRIVSQTGKVIEHETKITPTGCNGVLNAKSSKPSRAQLLAKALADCRKKYKHHPKKRRSCERAAQKKYGPQPRKSSAKRTYAKARTKR